MNTVIGKIYVEHLISCLLSTGLTKINKKRPGMAPLLTDKIVSKSRSNVSKRGSLAIKNSF